MGGTERRRGRGWGVRASRSAPLSCFHLLCFSFEVALAGDHHFPLRNRQQQGQQYNIDRIRHPTTWAALVDTRRAVHLCVSRGALSARCGSCFCDEVWEVEEASVVRSPLLPVCPPREMPSPPCQVIPPHRGASGCRGPRSTSLLLAPPPSHAPERCWPWEGRRGFQSVCGYL